MGNRLGGQPSRADPYHNGSWQFTLPQTNLTRQLAAYARKRETLLFLMGMGHKMGHSEKPAARKWLFSRTISARIVFDSERRLRDARLLSRLERDSCPSLL
jgi:hypothetical protein